MVQSICFSMSPTYATSCEFGRIEAVPLTKRRRFAGVNHSAARLKLDL